MKIYILLSIASAAIVCAQEFAEGAQYKIKQLPICGVSGKTCRKADSGSKAHTHVAELHLFSPRWIRMSGRFRLRL